ncbi:hypothetical protein K1719_034777 [Acacia pycnantha]|nr:hypothetical protein K1719_034777 [Acacia pycnantha]
MISPSCFDWMQLTVVLWSCKNDILQYLKERTGRRRRFRRNYESSNDEKLDEDEDECSELERWRTTAGNEHGDPTQRVAFFFCEALRSKIKPEMVETPGCTTSEEELTLSYKALCELHASIV